MVWDIATLCDLGNTLVEPLWATSMNPEDRHLGKILVDPVRVGQGNLGFPIIGYQSFLMQISSFSVPYTT